jgi:S1-C subfamily serine protease
VSAARRFEIASRLAPTARGVGLGAALLAAAALAVPARAAEPSPQAHAEKLVFLLQYVGADYGEAVREGRIADPFEYNEMLLFSRALVKEHAELRGGAASPDVREGLARLARMVEDRVVWEDVRALVRDLTPRLAEDLSVSVAPVGPLDAVRGRELYESSCATCHGDDGSGAGPAAAGLDPPPTSFRNPRMAYLSPHQLVGATRFGIAGTAMPSYDGVFSPEDLWNLASYVWTLRGNNAIAPATKGETAAPPASLEAAGGSTASGLDFALQLESAFAAVADRVFPSVVSVGAYVAGDDATDVAKSADATGWREAGTRDDPYPGFRLVRSLSGFFISDDGFLLTNAGAVEAFEGREIDLLDVEIEGRHYQARLVGAEPTVDLAVLAVDLPFATRPVQLAEEDSVRVGRWAIALGDPPGPERSFDAGTIAGMPERECYQEQRTATVVQTSCRLDPESYGGPLVDIAGRVIGVTVPRPGGVGPAAFLAFARQAQALPNGIAMTLYEALRAKESRRSPWLGFSVLELTRATRTRTSPRTGVVIDDVFDPSPAARAGIRVGDVLTAIDDHRVLSVADFQKWLYLAGIGAQVTLHVSRDGAPLALPVTIEERPDAARPVDATASPAP